MYFQYVLSVTTDGASVLGVKNLHFCSIIFECFIIFSFFFGTKKLKVCQPYIDYALKGLKRKTNK